MADTGLTATVFVCHPLETLLEKIDAIQKRFIKKRAKLQIINANDTLPPAAKTGAGVLKAKQEIRKIKSYTLTMRDPFAPEKCPRSQNPLHSAKLSSRFWTPVISAVLLTQINYFNRLPLVANLLRISK